MKQIQENYDLRLFNDNIEFPAKVSKAGVRLVRVPNLYFGTIQLGNMTSVRLDKCSQCGSAFYGAGNLKRHLKTHRGKRPNKCFKCNFASLHA